MSYKRKPQPIELIYRDSILCRGRNGKQGIFMKWENCFVDIEDYYTSKLINMGYSKYSAKQCENMVIVTIK